MPPSGDRPAAERALLSLLKGPVVIGLAVRDAAVSTRSWLEGSLHNAQRHVEGQLDQAREAGRSAIDQRRDQGQTSSLSNLTPKPHEPRNKETESTDFGGTSFNSVPNGREGDRNGNGLRRSAPIAVARPTPTAASPYRPVPKGSAASAESSADLPIPDYDELSALQVMDHLAGLNPAELAKVGAYERAGRGRRTILAKIDLLTG